MGISSPQNIVSKYYFCVQIWLVSKERCVVKLAEVSYLVSFIQHRKSKKTMIRSNVV